MKLFLNFIWIFLLSSSVTTYAQSDLPTHGPDIPLVGSSVFDQIFSKEMADGGIRYDVPFPLGRLTEKLHQLDASLVHTMLPFSRSLQRPVDLSYDPLLNPRLVLTPTKDQGSLTRGRLFIGYVKAKDQLEVISFNDQAGRFEFQIVTDYSINPQVFYVDRGKCLSCHQAQAPIFSPPGWQDTAFGLMGDLIVSKLGIDKNDSVGRELAAKHLFGNFGSRDNVATFDLLVREGVQIAFDERVWKEGCGEDDRCRLGLLLKALSPNARSTKEVFAHSKKVIENSRLAREQTFSSFVLSSPLNVPSVIKKYGSVSAVVNQPDAIFEIITSLYNLNPLENPATLRPIPLSGKDLSIPLTSFLPSDRELLRKEIADQDRVADILSQMLHGEDRTLFSGVIQKNRIMHAILSQVGSSKADNYAYWLEKPVPKKVLFKGPLPPVFRERELNLFSRHCSSCHATNLAFPPQFLTGSEGEVKGKVTGLRQKILWKLEAGLMPPDPQDRKVLHSSGDYERIVAYLKRLQGP